MKPSNCKIKKCKTNSMFPYSHDEDLHFCLCSFTSWKIMNTNKQERVCNLCIKPQYYDNNQKVICTINVDIIPMHPLDPKPKTMLAHELTSSIFSPFSHLSGLIFIGSGKLSGFRPFAKTSTIKPFCKMNFGMV